MVSFLTKRVLASAVALSFIATPLLAATTYNVDPVHSSLVFKIKHLNVSHVWGRIEDPKGSIVIGDDGLPSITVEVESDEIDTANDKRDEHLEGPDFFDAKQFPKITFKSTSAKKVDDNNFEVVGDFTLKGVTKSITVNLAKVGEADTPMGKRTGYDTSFTIKRSDYNMGGMMGPVGDEVTIFVSLEGVVQ